MDIKERVKELEEKVGRIINILEEVVETQKKIIKLTSNEQETN